MNKPSKEEVEEAIDFLIPAAINTSGKEGDVYKTAFTILTAYRDGELVEKNRIHVCRGCDGSGLWAAWKKCEYCKGDGFIVDPPTEPSNETK